MEKDLTLFLWLMKLGDTFPLTKKDMEVKSVDFSEAGKEKLCSLDFDLVVKGLKGARFLLKNLSGATFRDECSRKMKDK